MIILMHVFVALLSLILATLSVFRPNHRILSVTRYLAVATLGSGTYLVVWGSAKLVPTCISGVIYLGFVTALIAIAKRRLAAEVAQI